MYRQADLNEALAKVDPLTRGFAFGQALDIYYKGRYNTGMKAHPIGFFDSAMRLIDDLIDVYLPQHFVS